MIHLLFCLISTISPSNSVGVVKQSDTMVVNMGALGAEHYIKTELQRDFIVKKASNLWKLVRFDKKRVDYAGVWHLKKIYFHNVYSKKGVYEKISVDGRLLVIRRFNIDDQSSLGAESTLDYSGADFYEFPGDKDHLLVVLKPSNFAGLAMNYSLYQMIDLRNEEVDEFISYGDYACIISGFNRDCSFNFYYILGENSPENGKWTLWITKRNSRHPKRVMGFSLRHFNKKFQCLRLIQ